MIDLQKLQEKFDELFNDPNIESDLEKWLESRSVTKKPINNLIAKISYVVYEPNGQFIIGVNKEGSKHLIADIADVCLWDEQLSNSTKDRIEDVQNEIGKWLTDAISEKLEREILDSNIIAIREMLISDTSLSERAKNILIYFPDRLLPLSARVKDLSKLSLKEIKEARNSGKRTVSEIVELSNKANIKLA